MQEGSSLGDSAASCGLVSTTWQPQTAAGGRALQVSLIRWLAWPRGWLWLCLLAGACLAQSQLLGTAHAQTVPCAELAWTARQVGSMASVCMV